MSSFPLNKLPNDGVVCVLKAMNVHDQLSFSLCSNKTKAAVKSINLKAKLIIFVVSNRGFIKFRIRLDDSTLLQSEILNNSHSRVEPFCNEEFTTPKRIYVMSSRYKTLSIKNMGVGNWLHHLCEVFHHARVDSLSIHFQRIDVRYIEPIRRVINGLPIVNLDLNDFLEKEFQSKILETFPRYEELYIKEDGIDRSEINKTVIQNLRKLYIPRAQINLHQLLLSNCEEIKLGDWFLTRRDLKTFLNLWIRGSNPRLKYFHVSWRLEMGNGFLNMNMIFKDIKHTRIPSDSQEIHRKKISDGNYEQTELSGGFKIKRFDGTCAVIVLIPQSFKFIVNE